MGRIEKGNFYKVTAFDGVFIVLILCFSIGAILHTRLDLNRRLPNIRQAAVYHEGELLKHVRLDKDNEISLLEGRMSIAIEEGRIRVKESDCPRKICVNTGWIKTPGQIIACVPNKVLIEVKSANPPFLDAVVY